MEHLLYIMIIASFVMMVVGIVGMTYFMRKAYLGIYAKDDELEQNIRYFRAILSLVLVILGICLSASLGPLLTTR